MVEQVRMPLVFVALWLYAGFIFMKTLSIRNTGRPAPEWEDTGQVSPEIDQVWRKRQRKSLCFDLIRLVLDGGLLLGFLLSGLYPFWFGYFPDTVSGCCAGWFELISLTLLLSAFVDWIPVRAGSRAWAEEKLLFSDFLLKQLVNILRIVCGLALIWATFLVLEPVKAGLWLRLAVAALVILLFRGLLRLARGSGRKLQRLENGELQDRLRAFCTEYGLMTDPILVWPLMNRKSLPAAEEWVRVKGIRSRTLVLDEIMFRLLSEEEIAAAVMHRLERIRHHEPAWILLFRFLRGVFTLLGVCLVAFRVETGHSVLRLGPEAFWTVGNQTVDLLILITGFSLLIGPVLQLLRNSRLKKLYLQADRQVAEAGYKRPLYTWLAGYAGGASANPVPLYEKLCLHPRFLNERIAAISQGMGNHKGKDEAE